MKTIKEQVKEVIAQQQGLAREAAACFNLPLYEEANKRIAEFTAYLGRL